MAEIKVNEEQEGEIIKANNNIVRVMEIFISMLNWYQNSAKESTTKSHQNLNI